MDTSSNTVFRTVKTTMLTFEIILSLFFLYNFIMFPNMPFRVNVTVINTSRVFFEIIVIASKITFFILFNMISYSLMHNIFRMEVKNISLTFVPAIVYTILSGLSVFYFLYFVNIGKSNRVLVLSAAGYFLFKTFYFIREKSRIQRELKKIGTNTDSTQVNTFHTNTPAQGKVDNQTAQQYKYKGRTEDERRKTAFDEGMKELNSLVGMDRLKEDIRSFVNRMTIAKQKAEKGFALKRGCMHMRFVGPPGTGKTTAARIMLKLLYGMGCLRTDTFVEADREKFISPYVGDTAKKTKQLFENAMGGMILLDEAYSLTPRPQGFEQEAIDTMIKIMEDKKDDIVLIFAGYEDKMAEFINSNNGFKSRVPYKFYFEPYTSDELFDIAKRLFVSKKYILDPGTFNVLRDQIEVLKPLHAERNARLIDTLYDKIEIRQSNRLANVYGPNNKAPVQQLMTIEPEDIYQAVADIFDNND